MLAVLRLQQGRVGEALEIIAGVATDALGSRDSPSCMRSSGFFLSLRQNDYARIPRKFLCLEQLTISHRGKWL